MFSDTLLTWHDFISNNVIFFQQNVLAAVEFGVPLMAFVVKSIQTYFPQACKDDKDDVRLRQ